MRRSLHHILFLLLILSINPVSAYETDWTEKKLGKTIISADKAARRKNWSRAIKYGEEVLRGSDALDQHTDARYINQLKNLNRYYDKANRLQKVASRIKTAYFLSREYLGQTHQTTMISRTLYYKLLISNKDYINAIPFVLENISIAKNNNKVNYKLHHYLTQLLSLYGITGQLKKQEAVLLQFLKLNKELFGVDDENNLKINILLAKNYCRQKKIGKFKELKIKHHLQYTCKLQ